MSKAHKSKFIWLGIAGLLCSPLANAEGGGLPFEKEVVLTNPCAVFNVPTGDPNVTRITYGEDIDFALQGNSRSVVEVDSRGRVHLKFFVATHGDGVGEVSGIAYQFKSKALVDVNAKGYDRSGVDPLDAGFVYNGTVKVDARIVGEGVDAADGRCAQSAQDGALLQIKVAVRYADGAIRSATPSFTLRCLGSPWSNLMTATRAGTTKQVGRGFGDPWNKYAWSMRHFKGGLVVGTKNAFYDLKAYLEPSDAVQYCLDNNVYQVTDIHEGLACSELFAAPNSGVSPASADTRFAEIWRFNYTDSKWSKVRDDGVSQGFRIMATHNYKLFAGSDLGAFITGVDLHTGTPGAWNFPGSQLLMSTDGRNFQTIDSCVTEGPCNSATGVTNPYGLLGPGPGSLGAVNTSIRALASYKGKLYVGTFNVLGGELWSYDDVTDDWKLVHKFAVPPADPVKKPAVADLRVYKNKLYIGLAGPAANSYLYRYDGISVQQVPGQPPLPATNVGALTLFASSNGLLYVGNVDLNLGFYLQVYDGVNFRTISDNGFFNTENAYAWSIEEVNGRVFVGTFNQDFVAELPRGSAELWYSDDSAIWQQMALPLQFGLWNYGIRTMEVGSGRLFLGSASNMIAPDLAPKDAPYWLRKLLTPGTEVWAIRTKDAAPVVATTP